MKKKIIFGAIILVVAVLGIFLFFKNRFTYNDENVMGNTAGNLYNEGLFCEYEDTVYFANPYDEYNLYKMNSDGSNVEKVYGDRAYYINVANDYIYYERFNYKSGVEVVFRGSLYGLFRYKDGDSKPEELHNGIVDNVALCGNNLYYRRYDDINLYQLSKVKIDGDDDKVLSDSDYTPIAVSNGNIYFTEVDGSHDLLRLNTDTDTVTVFKEGNFYMPIICGNFVYYIDLDNNRTLTRMNLTNDDTQIIAEDKVVNYNLSENEGVIFYQAENSVEEHKLVRIDLEGQNQVDVAEGDCFNISITSRYTYYITKIADIDTLYRVNTTGIAIPENFVPKED